MFNAPLCMLIHNGALFILQYCHYEETYYVGCDFH